MKRLCMMLLIALLILSSCAGGEQEELVQPEKEDKKEISVIPNYSLSDEQYKILLPYRPSAAREAITNQITNRVDIDELEEGLRRHSAEVFDPEKYVFEEGQYLSTDFIFDMIDSLNPAIKEKGNKKEQIEEHRKNPRVFSHILEQNYLVRKDNNVNLVGLSIGISLKSVYRFQIETGGSSYYEEISEKEMLQEGKKIAEEVLKEIRQMEELKEVPILIALFREEKQSSPVPGHFVTKTIVDKGENAIHDWEAINEETVLFPSEEAKETYPSDYQNVKAFSDKVSEYFPNYVGVVGKGFYIEENLTRLSIEIPLEFFGKGEVIGFTQYTYGLVKEIFQNHYDIEVTVTSSDGAESIIYRKAGADEPNVHILH